MKMVLKQKIIHEIKRGKLDIYDIVHLANRPDCDWDDNCTALLRVIRDYLNGKFTLKPPRTRRK